MKRAAIYILIAAVIFSFCSCKKNNGGDENEHFMGFSSSSKNGGTVEAYMLRPDTLNPLLTGIEINRNALMLIYDSLFYIDNTFKARPSLASSFEFSDGSETLTVHLKNGVLWHDGSPFTSDDVVYTVNSILSYSETYCHGTVSRLVEKVYAPDEKTVVFSLKQPNSGAAAMLTFPILKRERGNIVNNADDYYPSGTGAFKVKSYDRETVMVLQRNNESKINTPYISEINFKILPDSDAAYSAFSSGITDFVKTNRESSGKISLSDSIGYTSVYSQNYTFMGLNLENELLKTTEIRRLLASAIAQANSIESLFGAYASVCDVPVNPNSYCYAENENAKTYDDAVTAAGCKYTDSGYAYIITEDSTVFLDFDLLVNEENAMQLSVAEGVKTALGNAGIAVNIVLADFDLYMERINSGEFDMFIGSTVLSCDMNLLPFTGSGGSLNYGGYASEKTDALLEQLLLGNDRREDVLLKIQADFRSSCPHIPLCFKNEQIIYNSGKLGNVNPVFAENCFDFLNTCTVNR